MYEKFPDALKEEQAWVNVWNSSKVPMRSTIKKAASSSLPSSWSSFEDAVKAVESGIYDGIGYVFHDSGLVGIDIDAGYDPDGFLSQLSIDIMEHCQSYTEKSRSGRGVHILLRGSLPFRGANNQAGVEIYRTSRYFICTGNQIVYPDIVENQNAINYVVSRYFKEVPRESQRSDSTKIYAPIYKRPGVGHIPLKPNYPVITSGSRNLSLTSLAGQLHNLGYAKADIYRELLCANEQACKPPLDRQEIETICNSVCRYAR